jgi:hypothetical protein
LSSVNPSTSGQAVTFTATVTANPSFMGIPASTVVFSNGSAILGTAALSGGKATLTTSTLAVGKHIIAAKYAGGTNYSPSLSNLLTQTETAVAGIVTTVVGSALNPSSVAAAGRGTGGAAPTALGTAPTFVGEALAADLNGQQAGVNVGDAPASAVADAAIDVHAGLLGDSAGSFETSPEVLDRFFAGAVATM